jgi:uncharacterized membrane protein
VLFYQPLRCLAVVFLFGCCLADWFLVLTKHFYLISVDLAFILKKFECCFDIAKHFYLTSVVDLA